MKLQAKKQMLTITMHEALVSGSVNIYKAEFEFDNTWDGYDKIAVFSAKNKEQSAYSVRREVLLSENSCVIPWEVLEEEGKLKIGVYGVREDKRLPTIYTDGEIILDGAEASSEGSAPTPEMVEQLLLDTKENREAAEKAAADAKADADRVSALAAEVAVNAAQTAQDASKAAKAMEAAQTAQRLAAEAQGAAEAARTAAAAAQAATEKAATDAAGAKQDAETAQKAAQDAEAAAAGSASAAANSAASASAAASAASESAAAAAASETAAKASEEAAKASEAAAKASEKAAAGSASAAQQSARSAAESAAVYDTVVANITQLKQDVVEITPDDTTVDGKPWTSKKIVDTICQPFEESGNPVQVYPVEAYPLGVKVSWEPVQEGSGDPSPDNIRPITGRDSVTIERCGENLLNIKPFNKVTNNGITYEYVSDGGIHVFGTATDRADSQTFPIWHLPPGKYCIHVLGGGTATIIVVQRNGKNLWLIVHGDFEILAGDVTKYWYMTTPNGTTVDETIYPYIVPGTTAPTTYKPYTGQTNTLTLPETVYGGEVDAVSGENNRTWRTITLTGEEASHIYTDLFYLDLYEDSSFVREKPANLTTGKSSHYKYHLYAKDCIGITMGGGNVVYSGNGKYPISDEGIQEWKAYLAAQYAAGTPVQICYKLAEPVPFTATGTQPIPALSGVNTIYTDADGVVVTGAEDPKHTITELKNAIISLGGNV